jgi:hypothetical protein
MGVSFSVEPFYSWFLISHRSTVMSSLLRSEVLVTVAVGSVAVTGLCHITPPVLHVLPVAMVYCCDMYNVRIALFVGKVAERFGPTLVCLNQV